MIHVTYQWTTGLWRSPCGQKSGFLTFICALFWRRGNTQNKSWRYTVPWRLVVHQGGFVGKIKVMRNVCKKIYCGICLYSLLQVFSWLLRSMPRCQWCHMHTLYTDRTDLRAVLIFSSNFWQEKRNKHTFQISQGKSFSKKHRAVASDVGYKVTNGPNCVLCGMSDPGKEMGP